MNEVVRGEASESEDETLSVNLNQRVLAAEVTGEASESDEGPLKCPPCSVFHEEFSFENCYVYQKGSECSIECGYNVDSLYHNNLLQRKLIENNLSIWRSLNLFVKNIVKSASKQLISTDQLLIKSQTSMQSVLVTLNQAQVNIKQLHEKIDAVFTTNFIPNINMHASK